MKASELLMEVEAEAKLKRLGWTKKRCSGCHGSGHKTKLGYGMSIVDPTAHCEYCVGSGTVWGKGKVSIPGP